MQRCCYLGSGANLPWCGTLCADASAVPRHLQESLTSRKRLGEAKAHSRFGLAHFLNRAKMLGRDSAVAELEDKATRVACLLPLTRCQERPQPPLLTFSE